jgi:hypothetical protein
MNWYLQDRSPSSIGGEADTELSGRTAEVLGVRHTIRIQSRSGRQWRYLVTEITYFRFHKRPRICVLAERPLGVYFCEGLCPIELNTKWVIAKLLTNQYVLSTERLRHHHHYLP